MSRISIQRIWYAWLNQACIPWLDLEEVGMKRGRMSIFLLVSCVLLVGLLAACNTLRSSSPSFGAPGNGSAPGEGTTEPEQQPDGSVLPLAPQPDDNYQSVTAPTDAAGQTAPDAQVTSGPGELLAPDQTQEGATPDDLPQPDPKVAIVTGIVTGKDGQPSCLADIGSPRATAPVPEKSSLTNEAGRYIWRLPAGTFTFVVTA